jgi:hypothetical protein
VGVVAALGAIGASGLASGLSEHLPERNLGCGPLAAAVAIRAMGQPIPAALHSAGAGRTTLAEVEAMIRASGIPAMPVRTSPAAVRGEPGIYVLALSACPETDQRIGSAEPHFLVIASTGDRQFVLDATISNAESASLTFSDCIPYWTGAALVVGVDVRPGHRRSLALVAAVGVCAAAAAWAVQRCARSTRTREC